MSSCPGHAGKREDALVIAGGQERKATGGDDCAGTSPGGAVLIQESSGVQVGDNNVQNIYHYGAGPGPLG
jgi:hypothetical protein